MLSEENEDFLNIVTRTQLEQFLIKYYFNNIDDENVKNCINLYISNVPQLKKLYKHIFGKMPIGTLNNKLKLQNAIKENEAYKHCDENAFNYLCYKIINENIDDMTLLKWLQKNGGYEDIELSHETLVEDFFGRLNSYFYYQPIAAENNLCGMNLTPFREKVPTIMRGINANVLSAIKIVSLGGIELLNNIVYCISEGFGMSNLKIAEDGTIILREIGKEHKKTIKIKTIDITNEEKLVLHWDESIIFCEGFNIKEIIPGNRDVDFAAMTKGLYNYILVCFDLGFAKKYRLYMAEAQPLEIGSKHWNIMAKVNVDLLEEKRNPDQEDTKVVIIAAGEIDITGMNLIFNFFSGTIFTKILEGECEVITGLNYEENSEDFCHSTIYDYFLAPYMKIFLETCNVNEEFSFAYTPQHLIDNETLEERGLIADLNFYQKVKKCRLDDD
jgi:hypothetical protein